MPSQPLALAGGFDGPGAAGGPGPGLGVFSFTIPPHFLWVLRLGAAAAELLCVPALWASSACACPLQVPAPPQVWASRFLPAQPGAAGPAAAVCPGSVSLLQEGLVTLRSRHKDCAGNELLLSPDFSSSLTAGAGSHLLGRAPGCWGWVGADFVGACSKDIVIHQLA